MKKMNKKYRLTVIASLLLVAIIMLLGSCTNGAGTSTGTITEITMAKNLTPDGRPVDPTNTFTTDTKDLYLSFKISGYPVGTKIEADWIYVGGDPDAELTTGKNYVAEKQTATVQKRSSGYTGTVYSRPNIPGYELWPKGDYKVVLYVDGVEKGSTTFKIEGMATVPNL